MTKKKNQDAALLARVTRLMAKPRVAKSAQEKAEKTNAFSHKSRLNSCTFNSYTFCMM
jgi:hypothetical protein